MVRIFSNCGFYQIVNCLVYGLTILNLDLGYAKTGETDQQPKTKPNWKTWPKAYIIELRWLKVYHANLDIMMKQAGKA